MLLIRWHDGESEGYTDCIPTEWLSGARKFTAEEHEVIAPSGTKRYRAKCDVVVSENRSTLDYRSYADFNVSAGMLLGVLRIVFEDSSRKRIPRVYWKPQDARKFFEPNTTISLAARSGSDLDDRVRTSLKDTREQRQARLKKASKVPLSYETSTTAYTRNPDVIAEVLLRADGFCESCKKKAPFRKKKDKEWYLEVHHKVTLANGGHDTVENAEALCPNCHRRKHYG